MSIITGFDLDRFMNIIKARQRHPFVNDRVKSSSVKHLMFNEVNLLRRWNEKANHAGDNLQSEVSKFSSRGGFCQPRNWHPYIFINVMSMNDINFSFT